jgi:hypothetical protein
MIFPRYIRVNTLKTTVDKVINQFLGEGYKLEEGTNNDNGDDEKFADLGKLR